MHFTVAGPFVDNHCHYKVSVFATIHICKISMTSSGGYYENERNNRRNTHAETDPVEEPRWTEHVVPCIHYT